MSAFRTHLYEALSYTWGDPHQRRSISIDGRSSLVTANLHAALVSLRDGLLERIVWVDAICINQDDNQEKGNQIRYMAEIYSKASPLAHSLDFSRDGHMIRGFLAFAFAMLYLAYVVVFANALHGWDYDPSTPTWTDRIYLAVTCFYMFIVIILSFPPALMANHPLVYISHEDTSPRSRYVRAVLVQVPWPTWARKEIYRCHIMVFAFLQYPLHLYSAVALRLSNENFLDSNSEREWGFGQVMALMLVADTIIRCGKAIYGYATEERASPNAQRFRELSIQYGPAIAYGPPTPVEADLMPLTKLEVGTASKAVAPLTDLPQGTSQSGATSSFSAHSSDI
ncbi:heterokaryon incompatibility protein-domain-containing protein [Lasiosphaeria ovina]|uniref:Heterokaryon incompatibility protein-domain-containing protein n=1 Tax=Lasiosphaeria ovina TaxID=92902 RepID=A0AAE0JTN2_9PEZI|nr:heterokaryon incompatibility protein-domain-containing protein [Lasiosphaeria ovina]